jgi:hypothetical protein
MGIIKDALQEVIDEYDLYEYKRGEDQIGYSYSFKYIGEKSTDCENVIIFNADAYKDDSQNQLQLF